MREQQSILKTVNQEKIIYDYLREYLTAHSPEETITEFRCLFIEGISQNITVRNAIDALVYSKIKREKFFYVLNYCFYIIIVYWLNNRDRSYILPLLRLFDNFNYTAKYYTRRKQKITVLIQEFVRSTHYIQLKRVTAVVEHKTITENDRDTKIADLLGRYTYLYQPLLVREKNILELSDLIQKLQIERTKTFELKLAQHIIYRTRLIEIAKAQQFSHGAGKIIRRIPNPTLLSNKDLKIVLKQYIKKIDKKITLYQLSRKFVARNKQEISYREFKRNLYFYLIYNIEPKNNNYDFSKKLWDLLDGIYYQSDTLPIDDNLNLRTCRKLYQYLIISNCDRASAALRDRHQHNLLLKLISNLGTAQTAMLLVKIVLICPLIKTDLEQRLAILYSCYETKNIEDVPWMVKFFEHFLIAFSIYFGKIDISLAKAI
jgi:hypothetical protein